MRTLIALLVLPAFFVTNSFAQMPTTDPVDAAMLSSTARRPLPVDPPHSHWEDFQRKFADTHAQLHITTSALPKESQTCRVLRVNEDGILCGRSLQHAQSILKADIVRVTTRHHDKDVLWGVLFTGVGTAGLGYSTYAVASILAASIPLGFFAFLFAVGLTCMVADFASGWDDIAYQVPHA